MTSTIEEKEWDGFIGWHKCSDILKRKINEDSTSEQVKILLDNWQFKWEVYNIARIYDAINEDEDCELSPRERVIADYFAVPYHRKYLMEKVIKKLESEAYEISKSLYELKKAQGLEKWWEKE